MSDNAGANSRATRVQVFLRLAPTAASARCVSGVPSPSNAADGASVAVDYSRDAGSASIRYTFDGLFDAGALQADVFASVGAPLVRDVLAGYNAAAICYGQTGTGKTFTMTGPESSAAGSGAASLRVTPSCGLLPRALSALFSELPPSGCVGERPAWEAAVAAVQVYREDVFDLLAGWAPAVAGADTPAPPRPLALREDPVAGVFVEGLTWHSVTRAEEALALVRMSTAARATAATRLNAHSSRSHAIVFVRVTRRAADSDSLLVGTFALVDLAGSERVSKSGVAGTRFDEAASINLSLSALGNCIAALGTRASAAGAAAGAAVGLADAAAAGAAAGAAARAALARAVHVPFRDSKLTRLLSGFLGGGARTALVICALADAACATETQCSLEFGARASRVRVAAEPNIAKDYRALCAALQAQLAALRLGGGGGAVGGTTPGLPDAALAALQAPAVSAASEAEAAAIAEASAARAELAAALARISELEGSAAASARALADADAAARASSRALADIQESARAVGAVGTGLPAALAVLLGEGSASKRDELADAWAREVAGVRLAVARAAASAVATATAAADVERGRADASLAALASARADVLELGAAQRAATRAADRARADADTRISSLLEEIASLRTEADTASARARMAEAECEVLRVRLRASISGQGDGSAVSGGARSGTSARDLAALYDATIDSLAKRVASLEATSEAQDAVLAGLLASARSQRPGLPRAPTPATASAPPASLTASRSNTPLKTLSRPPSAGGPPVAARPPSQGGGGPTSVGAASANLAASNAARFGLVGTPARKK